MRKSGKIAGGTSGAQKPGDSGRISGKIHQSIYPSWLAKADEIRSAFVISDADYQRIERIIDVIPGSVQAGLREVLLTACQFFVWHKWIRENVSGPDFKTVISDADQQIECFTILRPRLIEIGVDVDCEISRLENFRERVRLHLANRKETRWERDKFIGTLIEIYVHSTGHERPRVSGGCKEEFAANPLAKFVGTCLEIVGNPLSHDRVSKYIRDAIRQGNLDLSA